jgi:MFS family permease
MVDIAALTPRRVWLANAATLLQGVGMFGLFVLTLQLAQQPVASGAGLGLGATEAGLLLIPGAIVMLAIGPASSRLGHRVGDHLMLALGSGLAALGLALLALEHATVAPVLAFSIVASAGLGCAFPAMPALVSRDIETHRIAEAVAFNALMRGIGSAVGAQVSVAVLAGAVVAGTALPSSAGYERAYLLAAALSAVGAAVALAIRSPPTLPRDMG